MDFKKGLLKKLKFSKAFLTLENIICTHILNLMPFYIGLSLCSISYESNKYVIVTTIAVTVENKMNKKIGVNVLKKPSPIATNCPVFLKA